MEATDGTRRDLRHGMLRCEAYLCAGGEAKTASTAFAALAHLEITTIGLASIWHLLQALRQQPTVLRDGDVGGVGFLQGRRIYAHNCVTVLAETGKVASSWTIISPQPPEPVRCAGLRRQGRRCRHCGSRHRVRGEHLPGGAAPHPPITTISHPTPPARRPPASRWSTA